jgi:hypothetical protein
MVKRNLILKSSNKKAVKFKLYQHPYSGNMELEIKTPFGEVTYLYDEKDIIAKIATGDE